MSKRSIPIVMAANDKYAPYLGVSIKSMIYFFSKENDYLIFVLNEDISETHKERICRYEQCNVRINFIDVSELFREVYIPTVNHLSKETAYRFLVDLLFQGYERILYIDCDTIVRRDLAELYAVDIGDNVLGASLGRLVEGLNKYIIDELQLSPGRYFNAGVLIINIKKFREMGLREHGLNLLQGGKYICQDQDVLNILCDGCVFFIDGRWNVEWQHLTGIGGKIVIDEARKGTLNYINDPYIVHYTSSIKPWMRPDIKLAEYFWNIARNSEFYEEILYQNLGNRAAQKSDVFSQYIFPWELIKPNSRVIIYGYGNVGRLFYRQIRKTQYCNVVAICDKDANNIKEMEVPVIEPIEIKEYIYDDILICIKKEEIADSVRDELINLGIYREKLKWRSYSKQQ